VDDGAQVVKGIVAGCQESDCILMGGEVRAPKQRIFTSNILHFDVLGKEFLPHHPSSFGKAFSASPGSPAEASNT